MRLLKLNDYTFNIVGAAHHLNGAELRITWMGVAILRASVIPCMQRNFRNTAQCTKCFNNNDDSNIHKNFENCLVWLPIIRFEPFLMYMLFYHTDQTDV